MTRSALGTIAALFIVLAGTGVCMGAEPPPARGWLDVNIGALVVSERTLSTSTASSLPDLVSGGVEVRSDTHFGRGRAVDIAGGLLITRLVGAGVRINTMSRQGRDTISIRETGALGSKVLEGSLDIPELERTDLGVSISGIFVVPLHARVQAKAFGGPSYIRTHLDYIESVFTMPEFDLINGAFDNLRLSPVRFSRREIETSGWGYHVGGSVAAFLTRIVGVGVTVTYLRADNDFERPPIWALDHGRQAVVEHVRLGGLQMLAGLHLRF